MKPLTIILINMSTRADWEQGIMNKWGHIMQTGVVNRNWHVQQQLLKKPEVQQVISVDFIPYNLKKQIKQVVQTKLWKKTKDTKAKGFTWRLDQMSPKLWSMACLGPKPLKCLYPFIKPQTQLVVWSYNPFFPDVFSYFPQAISVFDTVDNWSTHPVYKRYVSRLQSGYQEIGRVAKQIFVVSPDLKRLFPTNAQVTWIPNGVDFAHFSSPKNVNQYQHLKQPFVVYAGVIQERFDFKLLEQTARLLPYIKFVIAGPIWKSVKSDILRSSKNIQFIGPIPYADLPNLFSRAVCGIIPHHVNRFTSSMNPLKLYEYLAAGLPVVSTPIQGTDQFPLGIFIAKTADQFAQYVEEAKKFGLKEKQLFQTQVLSHTWEQRASQMLTLLQHE